MLQRDHGQRVQNIIISLWWSIAAYLMPPYRYQPTYTLQCPCIHASTKKLSALQAATRCHETNTDHSKGTCSCEMRGHGRKFSWSWHRKHSSTMRLAYHHVKGTYTYHGYQNHLRWPATPRCEFHHKLLKHCNGGVQTVPRGSTYGHSGVTNQTLIYSGIGGLIFVMHIIIVVNCRVEPGGHHHQGHRRQWLLQLCLRPPRSSAGP